MISDIGAQLVRDFVRFEEGLTVKRAREMLADANQANGVRHGIVIDAAGEPLACLGFDNLDMWDEAQQLQDVREQWPPLYAMPQDQAHSLVAVRRLFGGDLAADQRAAV